MKGNVLAAILIAVLVLFGGQNAPAEAQENTVALSDHAWSQDGTMVAYVQLRGNEDFLYTWNTITGERRAILRAPRIEDPSFNRLGTRIVFAAAVSADSKLDLFSIAIDGSEQAQHTNTPEVNEWGPLYNQNGRRIYFTSDENNTQFGVRRDVFSLCTAGTCRDLEIARAETMQMTQSGLMYLQLVRGENPPGVYIMGSNTQLYQNDNFPTLFSSSWDGSITAAFMLRNGVSYIRWSGVPWARWPIEYDPTLTETGLPVTEWALSPDGSILIYGYGADFYTLDLFPGTPPEILLEPGRRLIPSSTPTSDEIVLFEDDFSENEGGVLEIAATSEYQYYWLAGEDAWQDYTVTMRVRLLTSNEEGSDFFINFRQNEEGSYAASFDAEAELAGIIANTNGDFPDLGSSTITADMTEWFDIRVTAQGETLSLYVNDELVIETTSEYHAGGGVNLTLAPNVAIQVDDVRVVGLDVP